MTEEEAKQQIRDRFGSDAFAQLTSFADLLVHETGRQNLVARSTIPHLWGRHILDSSQLLDHAPVEGAWLDVGSGGGLPGLVIAICRSAPITLVEPRRLRGQFLQKVVDALELRHIRVEVAKVENLSPTENAPAVISARAVASLDRLFEMGQHLASPSTTWLLPKGASAEDEVADAARAWHGTFHVERSATNPDSGIVIAREVRRR